MFIMEDMGNKPRRAFTPEFKAEIVEVCRCEDRSIGQVQTSHARWTTL
jgi:transposase